MDEDEALRAAARLHCLAATLHITIRDRCIDATEQAAALLLTLEQTAGQVHGEERRQIANSLVSAATLLVGDDVVDWKVSGDLAEAIQLLRDMRASASHPIN